MGTIRRVTRNVKRWRDAGMALRWVAAGMIEANKGFRRLKAHKQLSVLRAALQAHHDLLTIKPVTRHEGRVTFIPATSARRLTSIRTSPSVGRKGESEARAPTVDIATPTQPSVRENPRQGRARVPGDEMPIRLSQGSLSWHRQERRAGLRATRARQPIPCPQDTRVRMTKRGRKPRCGRS